MLLSNAKERLDEQKARHWRWRRWFAWRPVSCVNGDRVWLEFVERRGEWYDDFEGYTFRGYDYKWSYRRIERRGS